MERPSRTALKIARFMLLLDAVPRLRGLLPPGAAEAIRGLLLGSGAVKAAHVELMGSAASLRAWEWGEWLTGRGQVLWFAMRKRWLADTVNEAVRAGARQLLVVGAGFDPLASLTAQAHPEVLCVEIDAPNTALPKQRGIQAAGLGRDNLVICPADLAATPLAEALSATPWRREVRSVIVAEGLLMYLAPEAVKGFFAAVRGCAPLGSQVAFTCMDADARGRPRLPVLNGLMRWMLRLAGEPLLWGIPPADVPSFLIRQGFFTRRQLSAETLRARYLEPAGLGDEPLLPYEHLVLAEHSPGGVMGARRPGDTLPAPPTR